LVKARVDTVIWVSLAVDTSVLYKVKNWYPSVIFHRCIHPRRFIVVIQIAARFAAVMPVCVLKIVYQTPVPLLAVWKWLCVVVLKIL
jgi:hypothetical protein